MSGKGQATRGGISESGKAAQRGGADETYADIIEHKHYEPKNHPRMPRGMRAAQFSPFAALSGYEEMIHNTEEQRQKDDGAALIVDEDAWCATDES